MPKLPEPLAAGDRVAVFLPSSAAREPFRSQGLAALRGLGFRPVEAPLPLSRRGFFSRTPQAALRDLQRFLADPRIKALWAGRGGYGANQLLPLLDRLEIAAAKVVVASSDASVLLWHLLDRRQQVVFYGPMVYGGLAAGACARRQLLDVLCGRQQRLDFAGRVLCPGAARGRLTGGCLSNFVSLLATPHAPRLRGRILLLEDVNERPFRLDRMLWQCEQAGVFAQVRALLLGEFPGCFADRGEQHFFLSRWRRRLQPLRIPVLWNLPFGHARRARLLPLGVEAQVEAGAAGGRLSCPPGVRR